MKTFRFEVHGLTSDGCPEAVRRAIGALDGIVHVDVALNPGAVAVRRGVATVQADPDRVTPAQIVAAINGLGHFATLCPDAHAEQDEARPPGSPSELKTHKEPTMQTLRFDIYGMHCGGCAARVRRAICELDGIDQVDVTVRPGLATVQADPARATPRAILAAINRLGYLTRLHAPEHADQDAA